MTSTDLEPGAQANPDQPPALTDEQREAFLQVIRDAPIDPVRKFPKIGNIAALRQAGVPGTKAQLRSLLTDDLLEESRQARGLGFVEELEGVRWQVALDPAHPAWEKANFSLLRVYDPRFRDTVDVRHEGQLEVTNPDVAAAIDRFTALADAAIRAAARTGTGPAARDALPGGES